MTTVGNTSAPIPAGSYWVGDPCYAFLGYHDVWMACLETSGNENGQTILDARGTEVEGQTFQFVASRTLWGDGEYPAYGYGMSFSCPVDAGLIGVVPAAQVARLENPPFGMTLVEFPEDFDVSFSEDGMIRIGEIEVFTGGEE